MQRFRFVEEPEDQVFADMQTLNGMDGEDVGNLCDIVMDFLAEGKDLMGAVGNFIGERGIKNTASLKNTLRGLIFFIKGCVKAHLTQDQVKEDLQKLGVREDKSSVIVGKWNSHFVELVRAVIGQSLTVNELIDMDWSFGVTASNSELGSVGSTFLQLKLSLEQGQKIPMELSLPQFYAFLKEMERAKACLDSFT
eukprot:TRINITY_DN8790_c0_g1_i1.p1 TRINITY_DN8790_c0_g1~~TRINITY_DN8790_c0_g1_i1.p1  ORF type:complete len:195 (+),score=36.65 TRINITY_DN8790_c0_g1_i1:38-622(+)